MSNNLITDLDNIIRKYFVELEPVLDKANPNLVDPILKNIIYNKYDSSNLNTNMVDEKFYQNLINNININNNNDNTFFYLTNGINKNLKEGGSGTNKAITYINKDFFNLKNNNVIFNSKNIVKINLGRNDNQNIINNDILEDNTYPGTVLFKNIVNFKYKNKYNIEGVFHINGWDHKIKNVEKEEGYKKLVQAYYTAIMNHFFNIIKYKTDMSILHLIQCPGEIYKGTNITANILIETVKDYLINNKTELNRLNFRISIDYKQ
jgi:hypothetical protein